jgi:hypothetical protein
VDLVEIKIKAGGDISLGQRLEISLRQRLEIFLGQS